MTGESNFDIAEYIWIKLIKELAWARPTIALLCKTAVARNVLRYAQQVNLPISGANIYRIDAKKWFDAATDACLFKLEVGAKEVDHTARVFADLNATEPENILSMNDGVLIADSEAYHKVSFLDGQCALEWRQGVKHDLAPIMELRDSNGTLRNKLGQTVDVEDEYLFPLIKSSDLQSVEEPEPRYRVIVTQRSLSDDTGTLQEKAPRLWKYLSSHLDAFRNRKSVIYSNRPDFAMFGIGDYSFSEFKVAVSGLYKGGRFRVLRPSGDKPVMLDDTCYFLACDSLQQACVVAELLSHSLSVAFLNSIVFIDSKRPFTKKALQRLDVEAVLEHVDKIDLLNKANARLQLLGGERIDGVVTLHNYLLLAEQRYQQYTLL